ncbi:ComEC/Rec2 family competence protein [Rhizobium populisoli]|uniref:ComEC/Rec2 family competence protein n=1 Tax=Rhizobium populisoli TaxID=2859785 RepID=UPI001FE2441F|nr:ComEC/Rec2 family competence protein [Rhizobium populisoli]
MCRRLVRRATRLRQGIPSMLAEEVAYGHGFLFVPVLIGSGATCWFTLAKDPPFWPYLVAFLVLSLTALINRHHAGVPRLLPFGMALFLGGMMLAEFETWRRGTVLIDSAVTTNVTGVVERREVDARGRWRYLVRVEGTTDPEIRRQPQKVSLLAAARHVPAELGERLTGRARLSPPSGPALPGLNDFGFSAFYDGIGAVGFFYGAPKKETGPVSSTGLIAAIERQLFALRSEIGNRIRATVPGDAGAFAAAIVTDERRAISEETTEALRLAGLAHIIAISGLNMALAAGIFFVGVRTVLSLFTGFAQAYPIKKIAAFGALLMVTAYYLISGFGVSAERAYIMMAVLLVAVLFDRPSISLRNVAISALIIIAMAPSEILGPSFQMSFSATVALVAGYALWKRRSEGRDPEKPLFRHPAVTPVLSSWNFVAGIFVTSLIGGISTAMFSVEHFHRIATYGLAANLAAMPVISFIVMPAGLVGMLLMPFGLEGPFLQLMGFGLELVIDIAKHVAGWGGDVGVGRQHAWFLVLAAAGFLLLTLLRTKLRLAGAPFIALAFVLSWQERDRPLPELLISEDGTTLALLEGERVLTNRTKPPDFIYDQWRRALMIGDAAGPQLVSTGADPLRVKQDRRAPLTPAALNAARAQMEKISPEKFTCQPRTWCAIVTENGIVVAVVEDGRYAGMACDVAHLVVAPRARFDTCRSDALMVNGNMLRQTGALEITLGDTSDFRKWLVRTALAGEDRPWNRHRHYDWRSRAFDSELPEAFRLILSDNGG